MRTVLLALAALATATLLPSCGENPVVPPGPVPGWAVVTLSSPSAGDAALVLGIAGLVPPSPDALEPDDAGVLAFFRSEGSTMRVALFGQIRDGASFRFQVADIDRVSAYTLTVIEAAASDYTLRRDLDGYSLRVEGVPR